MSLARALFGGLDFAGRIVIAYRLTGCGLAAFNVMPWRRALKPKEPETFRRYGLLG
jgi:hypothetical protein